MISTKFALNFSCAFVQDEEITFSTRETSSPSVPYRLLPSRPLTTLPSPNYMMQRCIALTFFRDSFSPAGFTAPRYGILMRNLFIICGEFKRENLINVFHDKKKR